MASNATIVPNNGITGGNFDVYGSDRRIPRAMTAFTAIAWYNSIEILVLSVFVFKRYSGLYFWSIIITALSIALYATGAWMYQNNVDAPKAVSDAILSLGWIVMIPSQSIVLWSRLHLVSQNRKLLRFVLWLIIIDSVLLITPTLVLNLGSFIGHTPRFIRGYGIIEKIQMSVFTAQELFISGVYLWQLRRVMKIICEAKSRAIMRQLIAMNLLIILLDLVLIGIEACNLFMIQITLKSLVYSVKLKVEFAVLSKIVSVVRDRNEANGALHPLWKHQEKAADAEKATSQVTTSKSRLATAASSPFQSWRSSSLASSVPTQSPFHSMHDSLRYPENTAQMDDGEARYVRGLQQNVPPNWRLSIGHEAVGGPNLLEMKEERVGVKDEEDSIGEVDGMYPGRLG